MRMLTFKKIWMLNLVLFYHSVNSDSTADTSNEDGVNMTTTQDIINNGLQDEAERFIRILIFEGVQFRTAITNGERLWENGVVPYEISDDYSQDDRTVIIDALSHFNNVTCLRFRPRRNESSHIFIMPGSGCSAVIGKVPNNANKVSLGNNCVVKGIVLHELMHSLGFIHEQNRPDRDEFVRIDFDNIEEDAVKNFEKYSTDEVQTFNQTYDYSSVMHYGEFFFAKNKSIPTIIPHKDNVTIGQRDGFSDTDVLKINLLYNCTETNNTAKDASADYDVEEEAAEKDQRRQYKKLKSLLKKLFRF